MKTRMLRISPAPGFAGLLALSLALPALGPARGAPKPPPPPADPAIAYSTVGGALRVMNADGTNRTTILSWPYGQSPSWSPDGASIAHVKAGGIGEIWRVDVNVVGGVPQTSNLLQLTTDGAMPEWSPLGSEIAYLDSSTHRSIRLIPAAGGTPTTLYQQPVGWIGSLAWNPSATELAFTTRDGAGEWSIKILDRAGGAVTHTLIPGVLQFVPASHNLDCSRPGRDTLAFNAYPAGTGSVNETVYILDLPGGSASPLPVGRASYPGWSPDNNKIVYHNFRDIKTYTIASGAIGTLVTRSGTVSGMDWRRY